MLAEIVENYLKQAQHLSRHLDNEPGALQELLHTIECNKDQSKNDKALEEFFKGEYAFYNGQYEKALKHYLDAKGIHRFEFFCFRASAHVSKIQGHYDKAINFTKKSLEIFPEDYPSIILLSDLLKQTGQHQEAQQFLVKARSLAESKHSTAATAADEKKDKLPMGEKEMEELAGIFFSNPPEMELFCEEPINFCYNEESPCSKNAPQEEIKAAIHSFQDSQQHRLSHYVKHWDQRAALPPHALYILNGNDERSASDEEFSFLKITEKARQPSGGFYLRWNDLGMAINPGKNFLKNLHRNGLCLRDIDFVIVTNETPHSYTDLLEIYDLNYQLNKICPDFHLIRFYLSGKCHQENSAKLQPRFKQEKGNVHRLDLYIDSQGVEKIELAPGIKMHYFSPTAQKEHPTLALRFELSTDHESLHVGFVAGISWTPLLAQHLTPCDLLIASIGNTSSSDYDRIHYSDEELGYFGITSLIEELHPKLALCTEFGGKDGDIRLEIMRKMRKEFSNISTTLLPADLGMVLSLPELRILCSVTQEKIDPKQIHVVRSCGEFSKLTYLSPTCCL